MGYYNPIYVYGVEKFLADAKAAGVDGLIVVDLPPEEDDELCLPALAAGLTFEIVPLVGAAAWCLLTATVLDSVNVARILGYVRPRRY